MPEAIPSIVQAPFRDGVIELGIGQPDPSLLPVAALADATATALRRYGVDALGYGIEAGPPRCSTGCAGTSAGSTPAPRRPMS